ncbi:MAG: acyltransferase family protein [Candidatus Hydrogenedentes bacterium]|nr:acyltransferase family protein [Candidatus Hydrogenedentota bacterium]
MQEISVPKAAGRMDYVDNLRVFLTALVVCHHQSIAFGAPGGWYYVVTAPKDMLSQVVMTLFVAVNQAFFMSLFFFVAAYFTPISLDKKGKGKFARDRLKRLGIPLVVYFFLLNPSVVYLVLLFSGKTSAGYFEFMVERAPDLFGSGPMWFVLALIMFTAVYLAVSARSRREDSARRVPLPGNYTILVFIVIIGAVTFLVRLVYPVGTGILNLQLAYFPLYICMFAFGILANRWSWLDQLDTRRANRWFYVSIGTILTLPAIVLLGGVPEGNDYIFSGGLTWQAYAYAAWEPFVCVGICMKLLVFFRERLNKANALTARLSRSAYTVYILHPFFVVTATGLIKGLTLPPLALAMIACSAALIVAFTCSNVIRQAPLLNKVL